MYICMYASNRISYRHRIYQATTMDNIEECKLRKYFKTHYYHKPQAHSESEFNRIIISQVKA